MRFSITRRLLALLLVSLVTISFGASVVTYFQARAGVNDLLDHEMEQMVSMLAVHISTHPELSQEPFLRVEHDSVLEIWGQDGTLLFSSRPGDGPERPMPTGFSDFRERGRAWRAYAAPAGKYRLQIAQPLTRRRDLAAGIALRAMLPVAATVPLGALVIWLLVAYGLKPLRIIAKEVQTRDPGILEPIGVTRLPEEVAPLVNALNDLLNRLDHAARLERQFIADASHELRTPVSALSLSVDLLETAATPQERDDATQEVRRSVERLKRLVHQILTMARLEPEFVQRSESINLADFAEEIKADFWNIAAVRSIEFTLRCQRRPYVTGDNLSLRALIGNIIDNALRYTPAGGTVAMEVDERHGAPTLRVVDSGPGIPKGLRGKIFARFSRGDDRADDDDGVGLGLAIAKRAAERLNANLNLHDNAAGKGLTVTVEFPEAASVHRDSHVSRPEGTHPELSAITGGAMEP